MKERMERRKRFRSLLQFLDRFITMITALSYLFLLGCLLAFHRALFLPMLLVPAFGFFLLTAFRRMVNAPRPYEVMGYEPALPKSTSGKSFPSRHVFSGCLISITFLYVNIPWGILLFLLSVLLGAVRVYGGVHYLRDVLAGGIIAVVYGIAVYEIIFSNLLL